MKRNSAPQVFSRKKPAASVSEQSGFTIIEVMVSLVLLAIGVALSLASYREMIEKRQLTHGAEQILAFVNSAQLEASKRNRVVTVSYSRTADDNWCFGSVLGATACDCTETVSSEADYCAIDAQPTIVSNINAGSQSLLKSISGDDGGDNAYSFDPVRGLFVNLDDSLIVEMSSASQAYQINLTVSRTGQAILCSKDSSHSIPGYAACAVEAEEEVEESESV